MPVPKPPQYYGRTLLLKSPLDEKKFKSLERRKKKLLIRFLFQVKLKPLDKGIVEIKLQLTSPHVSPYSCKGFHFRT